MQVEITCPDEELWRSVGNFMFNKLLVDKKDLSEKSVTSVVRVAKGRRPTKITDEVIVTFCDVRTRDMVAAHASNLGRLAGTNYHYNKTSKFLRLQHILLKSKIMKAETI